MRLLKLEGPVTVVLAILAFACIGALAQSTTIPAKPDEQARIAPLVIALTKAGQARDAKIATLPEAQALRDAEAALTKARTALDKAAENLPENIAWKDAYAKVLDTAYDIQAKHNLSSREYQPRIGDKGELAFIPWTPPKP